MKHLYKLLFVFLTVAFTFPAVFQIMTGIIGDGGDSYQFLGFQHIAKRLFFSGHFPFGWTSYWRFPHGIDLQNVTDSSLFMMTGIFFYQFFSDPILVYNLSVLFLLFLNITISYYSLRMYFPRLIACTGAVMYGASFYTLARLNGHVNLMMTAGFPLFVFSVIRKRFLLFYISLLFIAFSSLQYPLLLIGVAILLLPFLTYFFHDDMKIFIRIALKHRRQLLLWGLAAITIFSLFHGHKLLSFISGDLKWPVNEFVTVPPENFIIPNPYEQTFSSIFINTTKSWIEYVVFMGYAELVLFMVALIFLKNNRTKIFLMSACVILFLLSAGIGYRFLFPFFPYRGIIEPGRFYVLFYLFFTLIILLYLRTVRSKSILIIILLIIILERLPLVKKMTPNEYGKRWITAVRSTDTRAVLDLPVNTSWHNGSLYDLYSVYYDRPIVNGYIHWSGESDVSKQLINMLNRYSCERAQRNNATHQEVLKVLKIYHIRTMVVHKDIMQNTCPDTAEAIDGLIMAGTWERKFEDSKKLVLWLND